MIVREPLPKDFDELVDIGEEFAIISKEAHGLSINRKKIEDFARAIFDKKNFISLVLEDEGRIIGIFTAQIVKTFFSDDIIAQELVWYVRKYTRDGLRLLFEFEKECVTRGVSKKIIGYKPNFVNMKSIYKRRGYKAFEVFFRGNV